MFKLFESLYAKRYILSLCLCAIAVLSCHAQRYSTMDERGTRHMLNLSVAGSGAQLLFDKSVQDMQQAKMGGAGQFSVSYEMQHKHFFFNLGVGADFTHTSVQVGDYRDTIPNLIDPQGHPITYGYQYQQYREAQRTLLLTVPVQIGYYFINYLYGAIGAKFSMPLLAGYQTTTQLETMGQYREFQGELSTQVDGQGWLHYAGVQSKDYYYYSPDTYTYTSTSDEKQVAQRLLQVAVTAELGANIPFRQAKRTRMRVGVYAEYGFRLGTPAAKGSTMEDLYHHLADYTRLDLYQANEDPRSSTQQGLHDNLHFRSALDNPIQARFPHALQVGLRLTFLLDLSNHAFPCRCVH